ncbi:MAG TPA: acetoin dehydrogenase [Candidatus Atribacteria bacterium]|uniref:Acetoin dehydrogenase E1 subunit alpha n=1 Tax=candidate division TA06 bacterium 34_109 TaxID=1635277 RepID=A0A117M630_UNCT6|nr:MAG: Acetoin dehydrogenase E1 subunit alpha [candidate division TA06 bacterium 34_109]HBY57218.1 acetoin dehydrogenase [Candidatus Atribacteria bacterium]
MNLSKETLKELYYNMVLIRHFEEVVDEYAKKGYIPGFVHLSTGQEACQAGVMKALKETDYKFPDHRSHGVCLLAGTPKERVLAEIFGKKTGISGGRGGSMHIIDIKCRNMGFNAIQGANLVTCLGTAFASQYNNTQDVTAVFFGDGTMGRGEVYEGMNIAAKWKLPILYVLVNNRYAISTRVEDVHSYPENLSDRAQGYCIPNEVIDGNDVIAVYEAASKAVKRAREGEGPTVLELLTYRWQGMFSGDPAAYRPKEEVEIWKEERCPIKRLREKLVQDKTFTTEELDKLNKESLEEIQGMLKYALESPEPEPEEAIKHVYVGREVQGR